MLSKISWQRYFCSEFLLLFTKKGKSTTIWAEDTCRNAPLSKACFTQLCFYKRRKKTKTKTPKQKWRWAFIYWFSSEPLQRQHSPPAGEVAPPSPLQEPHSAPVHQAPAALTCACEPLCSRPVYSVHSLPRRVLRELLLCCCHFGSQKASKKTLLSDNRENVYTIACPYMIY